jgi:drug/metabolite transporter (DMT)-like permease
VALLLIVTLWGSYPAMAKLALQDFPPFFLAAVRCTLASVFLVGLLARSGADASRGVGPAALRAFLVLGITGIWGSTQFTYVAIYYTTASSAAILQAATPVVVALGARLWLGERLGRPQRLGIALSAAGVLLVVTHGRLALLRTEELRAGDFINLASIAGWSAYTVYGKRVLATASPALATTAAYVLGTLLIIPTAAATAPLFPAPRLGSVLAWSVVLYQGLVGAVAHVWWYRAVHVVGPSRSAIFMNVQPVVGVLLATAILGERIGTWEIAGGALVLAGVALTTRERRRAPQPRPGPGDR